MAFEKLVLLRELADSRPGSRTFQKSGYRKLLWTPQTLQRSFLFLKHFQHLACVQNQDALPYGISQTGRLSFHAKVSTH